MTKKQKIIIACLIAVAVSMVAVAIHVTAKKEIERKPVKVNMVITQKIGKSIKVIETKTLKTAKAAEQWENLGTWRVTQYCTGCSGNITASGKTPKHGMVAMNGVPLGSVISVEGEEFVVEDRCGINGTVDIFMEWPDGVCHCSLLDYREVSIRRAL